MGKSVGGYQPPVGVGADFPYRGQTENSISNY